MSLLILLYREADECLFLRECKPYTQFACDIPITMQLWINSFVFQHQHLFLRLSVPLYHV